MNPTHSILFPVKIYKLYNEKLAKEVYYKINSQEGAVHIITYHNGDSEDKRVVGIDVARKDWDIRCNEHGFVSVEVEDHLQSINE